MRVGIDLLEIKRITSWADKSSIISRIYSKGEQTIIEAYNGKRRSEFMAGRMAVKEAVIKALGIELDQFRLSDIETLSLSNGMPLLVLHGELNEYVLLLGIREYSVSISHNGGYVIAIVIMN